MSTNSVSWDSGRNPWRQRHQTQNNLIFFPTQRDYRPGFARWNYNPTKALAILKAHCVPGSGRSAPNSANTKVWQCSGLLATFNWTWNINADARSTTEQIAKAELRSIGVEVVDRPGPGNTYFDRITAGNFDIAAFTWSGGSAASRSTEKGRGHLWKPYVPEVTSGRV